jgi:hypothetical protein
MYNHTSSKTLIHDIIIEEDSVNHGIEMDYIPGRSYLDLGKITVGFQRKK